MANLLPNLILQRAPNIKVLINSSTDIKVLIMGMELDCGALTLPILNAFSYPVAVSEALNELQAQVAGAQDWINLTAAITRLYNSGVLIDKTQVSSSMSTSPHGFDTGLVHTVMLNDRARTSAFFAGIREVVRPGDVVLDIGTGTGVLAIAAARAGARHVYAIEASGIADAARAMFEANGLADRITLLPGWSTQINLPERGDVLISEIIGNEPLGEMVLETTMDARQRLLKPDARLVPGKLKIFGLPITIPDVELAKRTFTDETLKIWQSWYGIDFNPLREMVEGLPQTFFLKPQKAKDWVAVGDPVLLADVDLKTVKHAMIDHTAAATANIAGKLNGLLIFFELELGPSTILSTHPARADEANHWLSLVWISTNPLNLQAGDRFNVTYRYRVPVGRDRVQITQI